MSSQRSSRAPSVFSMPTEADAMTTPPSSPPTFEESSKADDEDVKVDEDTEQRLRMLSSLIEKSSAYVSMLKQQMDKVKVGRGRTRNGNEPSAQSSSEAQPPPEHHVRAESKKRPRDDAEPGSEPITKRAKLTSNEENEAPGDGPEGAFEQPALITGTMLKDYQLEGVAWMAGLYQSGISGILADEMGLGKTLQTIAFHAFLRERTPAPFLVVCPLSVLSNWVEEFRRFAPAIPVVMYHGTPDERAEIRRTAMVFSEEDMTYQNRMFGRNAPASTSAAAPTPKTKGQKKKSPGRPRAKGAKGRGTRKEQEPEQSDEEPVAKKSKSKGATGRRKSGRLTGHPEEDPASDDEVHAEQDVRASKRGQSSKSAEKDEVASPEEVDGEAKPKPEPDDKPSLPPRQRTNFPVVVTTYEMVIKDRAQLAEYFWGFIVVDEGHRLKNMDCKLMREIKKLNAAARMVLTGTPLHNNLAELWALLNFVLPDLFSNLDAFEEWFNLPMLQSTISESRSSQLIQSLHAILRPFLLRRLKADVEANLPPKKEYVLYAPLSERQRELYNAIVDGGLRALLVKEGERGKERKGDVPAAAIEDTDEEAEVPLRVQAERQAPGRRNRRAGARRIKRENYDVDGDDDEYFAKLESGELEATRQREKEKSAEEMGREWQRKNTLKKVNNMKLQNTVMQLRKVCSHPFLFDWPVDPDTREPVLNEELASTSGKMMILDRLLDELFARKHKVLLFSQFTTMLDIIEDWALEFKGWSICRIDGSTSMSDRREEVSRFQNSGEAPDAPRLFLLSTRAGGLGLNLVAADTVIFYDQDWNPQMDLQAQDRAHRIGQTKPVLIFRIVSAHTIETKIMQRATEKRKLEALVIAKGQFKTPSQAASRNKPETIAEMAAELLRLEGQQIQVIPNTAAGKASVISDEELDVLLDRRPEVFVDRGKGWTSAGKTAAANAQSADKVDNRSDVHPTKTTFAVYETALDETGDVLAGMMAEDTESQ